MSKCVKNNATNNIQRVNDDKALELIATGNYVYVSKTEWKNYLKTHR